MNGYGALHTHIIGDCIQEMPKLQTCSFDLLLTDPPYAMPATFYEGRNPTRKWSDSSIMQAWWRMVIDTAIPLLKPDGMVAVFANANAVAAFWPCMYEKMKLQLAVWDKGQIGMGRPLRNSCEFIIVGSLGDSFASNQGASNIFRFSRSSASSRTHQAQKPSDLIKHIVSLLCPDGGNVLDPFAGSCVTAGVCEESGRRCTTIEWDDDFDNGRML